MSDTRSSHVVREARRDELAAILDVQRRAFGRVASDLGIDPALLPPIRETFEEVASLFDSGARFFVALSDEDRIIGSVRGTLDGGVVDIGRLVVDDGWQRQGVASAVMDALEAAYPEATAFRLFTGEEAGAALALYAKRGYQRTTREDLGHVVLVWLEKRG